MTRNPRLVVHAYGKTARMTEEINALMVAVEAKTTARVKKLSLQLLRLVVVAVVVGSMLGALLGAALWAVLQ